MRVEINDCEFQRAETMSASLLKAGMLVNTAVMLTATHFELLHIKKSSNVISPTTTSSLLRLLDLARTIPYFNVYIQKHSLSCWLYSVQATYSCIANKHETLAHRCVVPMSQRDTTVYTQVNDVTIQIMKLLDNKLTLNVKCQISHVTVRLMFINLSSSLTSLQVYVNINHIL